MVVYGQKYYTRIHSWHENAGTFPRNDYPWFTRGETVSDGTKAGQFASDVRYEAKVGAFCAVLAI